MVDLRLMVANLKFIFLICFQQETLADGIVPTNVNVLLEVSQFLVLNIRVRSESVLARPATRALRANEFNLGQSLSSRLQEFRFWSRL